MANVESRPWPWPLSMALNPNNGRAMQGSFLEQKTEWKLYIKTIFEPEPLF